MSTYRLFDAIFEATIALIPTLKLDSPAARAMLVAIALQESRFQHRRQIGGPARGFWQFERKGGVQGVLTHKVTRAPIKDVLNALMYAHDPETSYTAIEHNDVLACAYARLLLWTLPGPLPQPDDPDDGWKQYVEAWRPGKPHPETWEAFYAQAWADYA